MAERERDRNELAYDVGNAIGWAMGAVAIAFARPMVWLVFHDWSSHRRPALHVPVEVSKKLP